MGVDYHNACYLGFEFEEDTEIDFYKVLVSSPKKCFPHNIPYDVNHLFDPKTGEKLWDTVETEEPLDGYDENEETYKGLDIHTCGYAGQCEYIGKNMGYFTSMEELSSIGIDQLRKEIKSALETLGIEFKEEKFGIHSFTYAS